jgi:NAD(P)-dependent dehydrogenase (short-subunit alcohol dehydrogenase family)
MGNNTFWIIGGGRFGLRAAEILGHQGAAEVVVVDHSRERCRELADRGLRVECADGISFLTDHLRRPDKHLWIVAAAPVHVAFLWLQARLSETARVDAVPVPAEVAQRLPNAVAGGKEVFASNAVYLPPDCKPAHLHGTGGCVRAACMRSSATPQARQYQVCSFQFAAGIRSEVSDPPSSLTPAHRRDHSPPRPASATPS